MRTTFPAGQSCQMKEIAEDQSLRATGTIVEVDHPDTRQVSDRRQPDQAVGQPVGGLRSPLLGEHTEEILRDVLGYTGDEIAEIKASGATEPAKKMAAE